MLSWAGGKTGNLRSALSWLTDIVEGVDRQVSTANFAYGWRRFLVTTIPTSTQSILASDQIS